PLDLEVARLRYQLPELLQGQELDEEAVGALVPGPDPDVRVPSLVSRPCPEHPPERHRGGGSIGWRGRGTRRGTGWVRRVPGRVGRRTWWALDDEAAAVVEDDCLVDQVGANQGWPVDSVRGGVGGWGGGVAAGVAGQGQLDGGGGEGAADL